MIVLRNYQEDFIKLIRSSFKKGNTRVCCVAGCGAGKTVLASYMCENHNKLNENNYCWFLVHRQELIDQTIATFNNNNISMNNVMINMVQTVSRHLDQLKKPTLIIFDEAHHILAKTWQRILDAFPGVPVVGLTATPCRLDNKPLGNVFDTLCETVPVKWLIDNKYLSDYEYYAPKFDFEEKRKGSDFDQEYISNQFMERKIYGDVIKYINPNKKTIIYCPSIKFSKAMADNINESFKIFGEIAKHFDGDTPDKQRKEIISDFRNGKTKILCNVDLIGEGFDVPDCDCCILLRPTLSTSLYIQQSMRCMRYKPNKTATIYDMVGNCYRHGLPDEDREWSLEFKPRIIRGSSIDENDVVARMCNNCFRIYRGNNRICPYCGYDNGKTKKQIEQDKKAELEKVKAIEKAEKEAEKIKKQFDKDAESVIKKTLRQEVGMAKDFGELVAIGKKRGYKYPDQWAKFILRSRNGKGNKHSE